MLSSKALRPFVLVKCSEHYAYVERVVSSAAIV